MDVVSALANKIGGAVPQAKSFTDSISKLAGELKGMNSDPAVESREDGTCNCRGSPGLDSFWKWPLKLLRLQHQDSMGL